MQKLQLDFTPAFSKPEAKSILNKHSVTVTRFDDKSAVLFANVISSTADNTPTHFKADILIVTKDKRTSKQLAKQEQLTALILTNTMSEFKWQDVSSINGKKFLKESLKRELQRRYGEDAIISIYFENFIHS